MSTTFAPPPSASVVPPASADAADVRLTIFVAVVCVADSTNKLP